MPDTSICLGRMMNDNHLPACLLVVHDAIIHHRDL